MKFVTRQCVVAVVLAILSLVFSTSLFAAQTVTLSCASNIGEVGVPYSSALVASGGVGPYTFLITGGSLPPGLTLDPSSGAITGTPSKAGAFSYVAEVVDSAGNTGRAKCHIHIAKHVSLDCPKNNKGAVGEPFSELLRVYPGVGPYTYAIISGQLAPGLTLNPRNIRHSYFSTA